jgi:hypothetical protein
MIAIFARSVENYGKAVLLVFGRALQWISRWADMNDFVLCGMKGGGKMGRMYGWVGIVRLWDMAMAMPMCKQNDHAKDPSRDLAEQRESCKATDHGNSMAI